MVVGADGHFPEWQNHGVVFCWLVLEWLNLLVLMLAAVFVHLFRTAERSWVIVIFF